MSIDLDRITHARRFLAEHLAPTRLVPADAAFGPSIHLKLEVDLPTGSFKIRGALYALSLNCARHTVAEVVAASTGNHGAAVAHAARLLGVRARIFLPRNPNPVKAARIAELGATIDEDGDDLTAAIDRAKEYSLRQNALFLHDASDADIPAGTGTIGLEIVEQLPEVRTVVVQMGDTALIRGVASAVKAVRPGVRVVGVVAAGAPAYLLSWNSGTVVETPSADTVADGLAVTRPLPENVAAIRQLVDEIRTVSDDEMIAAARLLWSRHRITAEPSGAASLAALLQQRGEERPAVALITGSSLAPDIARRVMG